MRDLQFINGEYYHIYSRGVDKRKVFLRYGHYRRFLSTIKTILNTGSATPRLIYNQSLALNSKVEITCYCLMPNHYHLLLMQKADNGITEFMHKINTSYTKYINLNEKRSGRLFETTFKAKQIESDELFLHVCRYIHLNPVIAGLVDSPDLWPWSSYLSVVKDRPDEICTSQKILSHFGAENPRVSYEQFVNDQRVYAQLLHEANEMGNEDRLFL